MRVLVSIQNILAEHKPTSINFEQVIRRWKMQRIKKNIFSNALSKKILLIPMLQVCVFHMKYLQNIVTFLVWIEYIEQHLYREINFSIHAILQVIAKLIS